jgi:hypothetical protein
MIRQSHNFDERIKQLTVEQRDQLFDVLKDNIEIFSTLMPDTPFLMLIKSGDVDQAKAMMKNLGK